MSLHFTPLELLLIIVGDGWPISLIVVALLLWVSVRHSNWPRFVASPIAVFLIICLIYDAQYTYNWKKEQARRNAESDATDKRLTVTVTADTPVARSATSKLDNSGILPAGSKVEWYSDAHDGFYWADLSRPARFIGVNWQGYVEDPQDFWDGTLSGDQVFEKWHCKDGEYAQFDTEGKMMVCVIARDYRGANQLFPAGMFLTDINDVKFTVPHGGVLRLSAVGIVLMPDEDIDLDSSGHITGVSFRSNGPQDPSPEVRFRGAAIDGNFSYKYTGDDSSKPLLGIAGRLSQPLTCGARTIPKYTNLLLPLIGTVVTAKLDVSEAQQVAGCQLLSG